MQTLVAQGRRGLGRGAVSLPWQTGSKPRVSLDATAGSRTTQTCLCTQVPEAAISGRGAALGPRQPRGSLSDGPNGHA